MREEVRKAKRLPRLRNFAVSLVRDLPAKDFHGEIARAYFFVRNRIRYTLDINGIELVQEPELTLRLGTGDCDDKCVLLASLLELLGHACYFCAMGFDRRPFYTHVIVLVDPANDGEELIALDATENKWPGWYPPRSTRLMIAPMPPDDYEAA